jgi:hypothetical protein
MECPSCKAQLKDTAKFCGKCGTKIESANPPADDQNKCIKCGNPLKPNAKFCGKCGAKQEHTPPPAPTQPEEEVPNKGYVVWEMQPGQIAARLTEEVFSEYAKTKGVVIPEGYLAMVMCGGKLQSMLQAGVYKFGKKTADKEGSSLSRFFTGLFGGRNKSSEQNQKDLNEVNSAIQKRLPIEVVLCRSSNFSLPFTIKEVPTAAIKVDLGMLLSVQVSNLVEMYKKHLMDKTVLASDTFAKELLPYLEDIVKQTLSTIQPDKISLNNDLKEGLGEKLKAVFGEQFGFMEFLGVVKLETSREELERLERLSEEMYLSERELEQLTRRNEFMNRLTQEQNRAELQNAQNSADFNRQLAEINKDNLLTEEEMGNVQREIQERSENHKIDRAHALDMIVIQQQQEVQAAHIRMEEELGEKLFNIQQQRQRKVDEYQDERRRREMEMDKEEQLGQLELLKQAQNIRQEREEAELARKLKEKEQEQNHEKERLNIFAGMSAEQIMVANPAITPEAAKAMAEKFKAEAAEAANDNRAENAQEQTRMMKEFMEQQMQAVRDMSASNAQAMSQMMENKDKEIERTQQIVDKNEDRYADVVKEQIKSGKKGKVKVCTNCGSEVGDEIFCPECGTRQAEE